MARTISVQSGQVLKHRTFDNRETINVLSGGVATHDTLEGVDQLQVYAGGSASHIAVTGDSSLVVLSGGSANDIVAMGTYCFVDIAGSATDARIEFAAQAGSGQGGLLVGGSVLDGTIFIEGGTVSGVTFHDSLEKIDDVPGATASVDVRLTGDSRQDVYATATSSFLIGGSTQTIENGGTAIATTLGNGGMSVVDDGGTASGVTIGDGGVQIVSSGGSLDGATVQSGGTLFVLSGGSATDVTAASGANVITRGVVTIDAAGRLLDRPHFVVKSIGITSGSTEYVLSGGEALKQVILPGGMQIIYAGGLSDHEVIQGLAVVDSGGSVISAAVHGADSVLTFTDGATGARVDVSSGGHVDVETGATVDKLTISAGGMVRVNGAVHGLHVDSGGLAFVTSGSDVQGVLVANGGVLEIDHTKMPGGGFSGDGHAHGIDLQQGGALEYTDLHYSPDATATLGPDNLLTVTQPRAGGDTTRSFSVHLVGDYTGATFAIGESRNGLDTITRIDHAAAIPAADLARDIASVGGSLPAAASASGPGAIGASVGGAAVHDVHALILLPHSM